MKKIILIQLLFLIAFKVYANGQKRCDQLNQILPGTHNFIKFEPSSDPWVPKFIRGIYQVEKIQHNFFVQMIDLEGNIIILKSMKLEVRYDDYTDSDICYFYDPMVTDKDLHMEAGPVDFFDETLYEISFYNRRGGVGNLRLSQPPTYSSIMCDQLNESLSGNYKMHALQPDRTLEESIYKFEKTLDYTFNVEITDLKGSTIRDSQEMRFGLKLHPSTLDSNMSCYLYNPKVEGHNNDMDVEHVVFIDGELTNIRLLDSKGSQYMLSPVAPRL